MQVIPFTVMVLIGMFTPGPNIIMVVNNARTNGVEATFPLLSGMSAGYACIMFCAALFNIYLLRVMPAIRPYLGLLGASYMLWLAVKIFLPRNNGAEPLSKRGRFFTGVALQFINPKVILNSIAVMASFILPHFDALPILALFAGGFGVLCLISLTCWAFFGTLFQRFFSTHTTALNVVTALLLIYCAYAVSGLNISTLFHHATP